MIGGRYRRRRSAPSGVVVVGGGIGGLVTALALGRAGQDVTVVEQDPLPRHPSAEAAFAAERRGVPQAHQTHGFLARLLVLLRDRFPDVLAELEAAGGSTLSMAAALGDPRPGDDDIRVLVTRRTTLEWVLRRAVEAQAGVAIRTGATVAGLVTSGTDGDGRPVVTGVRLDDGSVLAAEAVIAATGSRGNVPAWLASEGIECPELVHRCGHVYMTRWYRRPPGAAAGLPRLFGHLPYLKVLGVPGDGDALSVTLAVPKGDIELRRALSDPIRFDRACRLIPALEEHFGPGAPPLEPMGGVRPMAGLVNRLRRFTDEGGDPVVVGFHAVGDAHTATNPLYGRGCSLAAVQALLLADAHLAHPGDPRGRAVAYEAACRDQVEPWFDDAVLMEALESGEGAPSAGPDLEAAQLVGGMFLLGADDPTLGRALARYINLLQTPRQLLADAALVERVTELATRPEAFDAPGPQGPTRDDLLAALDAPSVGAADPSPSRRGPVDGLGARLVRVGDVELHVVEAGPPDGPPVVLAHGFPDISYTWRRQVPALASAGYRVVAPDQRGYGRSSGPEEVERYDIHHLTGDLVGLLDELGHERATFVGHDWGSLVVGSLALLHPERVRGVVALSVPLLPRGPGSILETLGAAFGESFFYMRYFQEPGVADADLGRDPAETLLRLLAGGSTGAGGEGAGSPGETGEEGFIGRLPRPDRLPPWLSDEDLAHYVEEFTRSGFTGGLSWYRNLDRNWRTTEELASARLEVPSAYITGRDDPVDLVLPASVMDGHVTDHRSTSYVDGAGHWVHQERPEVVNALLLDFLASLGPPPPRRSEQAAQPSSSGG